MLWKKLIIESIKNKDGVIIADGGTCAPSYVIPRLLAVLEELNNEEYERLNREYETTPDGTEEIDFLYEE
ncbi:MAG: hypothetical protein KAW12_10180, partial [Candidatus Aminicenantes bacterium]|nr:hypothetical protein [Candidatus Aminicenantes bacterium]